MQTELAQIISLTSYGNEFMRTEQVDQNYFPGSSVFQHCNLVDFRDFKKSFFSSKKTESVSANNPLDWFRLLKKEGCVKLRLYYKPTEKNEFGPEYNLAGFSGGAGTWLIETNFGGYSHYWQKRWQVTQKDAPDNKVWGVNYARIVEKFTPANQQLDVEETKSKLAKTIKELVDFCLQQDLKSWLDTFQKADKILSDPTPNKLYYHQDLLVVKNYSLNAQQLLFAAGTAWVFGGMGWWNDMGFNEKDAQEIYIRLSQQLYEQLLQSILATSNSF
ncbi:MAG TPA: hypothetical protein VK622_05470 [Puia sp.]|nr:hypothetical protein [Puia sp.]